MSVIVAVALAEAVEAKIRRLTGPGGRKAVLGAVPSAAALSLAKAGVFVASDTGATVKLPTSLGAAGAWQLSFTPSRALYPGAALQAPLGLTYAR